MAKIVYVDEHGKKNGMLSGAITSEVLFAFGSTAASVPNI